MWGGIRTVVVNFPENRLLSDEGNTYGAELSKRHISGGK
jgi:hypothetical protein